MVGNYFVGICIVYLHNVQFEIGAGRFWSCRLDSSFYSNCGVLCVLVTCFPLHLGPIPFFRIQTTGKRCFDGALSLKISLLMLMAVLLLVLMV